MKLFQNLSTDLAEKMAIVLNRYSLLQQIQFNAKMFGNKRVIVKRVQVAV